MESPISTVAINESVIWLPSLITGNSSLGSVQKSDVFHFIHKKKWLVSNQNQRYWMSGLLIWVYCQWYVLTENIKDNRLAGMEPKAIHLPNHNFLLYFFPRFLNCLFVGWNTTGKRDTTTCCNSSKKSVSALSPPKIWKSCLVQKYLRFQGAQMWWVKCCRFWPCRNPRKTLH